MCITHRTRSTSGIQDQHIASAEGVARDWLARASCLRLAVVRAVAKGVGKRASEGEGVGEGVSDGGGKSGGKSGANNGGKSGGEGGECEQGGGCQLGCSGEKAAARKAAVGVWRLRRLLRPPAPSGAARARRALRHSRLAPNRVLPALERRRRAGC